MSLSPGTRLGPYEVTARIGEGGMGEVYRATDTKLKREVAIKVLPDSVAADHERLARFQREAEVLASLNHPHIAGIYGLESFQPERSAERSDVAEREVVPPSAASPSSGGLARPGDGRSASKLGPHDVDKSRRHVPYLVMELVEGEDLAERLKRGAIPIDEAIAIAKQIADGLEEAHERGIIHRDLKPANVRLTPDGKAKVLDFGLAKALEGESAQTTGNAELSHSPTISRHATAAGMILGTAAYMSPEQARGKPVDRRADVWSFGVVLYEMLTGNRAFEGEDVSVTLADVIRAEPDWDALPVGLPPALVLYLKRCLEKDPRERVQAIGDVRLALAGAFETDIGEPPAGQAVARQAGWRQLLPWIVGTAVGLVTGFAIWSGTQPDTPRVVRVSAVLDATEPLSITAASSVITISPDGAHIAYLTGIAGDSAKRLHVRPLEQLTSATLVADGQLRTPFFSPDGESVGFSDGTLAQPVFKRVAVRGGPITTICEYQGYSRGASWGDDGTIVFATTEASSGLWQVPAVGGQPVPLTTPEREGAEGDHWWPDILPGAEAVLFTIAANSADDSQLAVVNLATREQKVLIRGGTYAQYSSSGHLIYQARGNLWAVAFDLNRLETVGEPVPVQTDTRVGLADFSVSENGSLVYVSGSEATSLGGSLEFVWVTRSGEATSVDAGLKFGRPARDAWQLSTDGSRIAFGQRLDGNDDIWVKELPDGAVSRLTFDDTLDLLPEWAPDGQSVTYRHGPVGQGQLWSKRADGSGEAELLFDGFNGFTVQRGGWSPDGKWLVLQGGSTEQRDIYAIRPGIDTAAVPLVATEEFSEESPAISRDGRWLAYSSNETGRDEIFVRAFPEVDAGKWQISTDGGVNAVWAHNGRELFFANPETRELKAAEFTTTSTTFQRRRLATLFEIPQDFHYFATSANGDFYDVALDDERFLMARRSRSEESSPSLILVLNWFSELERLVPTN